ncbi:MAG: DNA-deoxyinosine glycosylase [Lachnospiraceae bacterium]|nr:DNA-deoxyinosine glycosylase [Lachnospiraceae bacterium]
MDTEKNRGARVRPEAPASREGSGREKPDGHVLTVHPIPPVYDADSRILVLGSFPSVKSREEGFFYGHPQNRFWKVTAAVFGETVPRTVGEKRAFLLRNRIALWDVVRSCEIRGSSDASIRNVTVNDLGKILEAADIRAIFTNGAAAYRYYRKYAEPLTGRPAVCLPSTSPANASWDPERLTEAWTRIRLSPTGECGIVGDHADRQ